MRVSTESLPFEAASFRDPDTRVFRHNGAVLRCLSRHALEDWEQLAATDFFKRLTAECPRDPDRSQVGDRTGLPALDAKWVAVLETRDGPDGLLPLRVALQYAQGRGASARRCCMKTLRGVVA